MDIELFLTEINPETPAGENLEYDIDFMEMEKASVGKAEQQFGQTIIPAESPDWVQVVKLGESLLGRTKDLRVIMYLIQGWTELNGITGFLDGLNLLNKSLNRFWSTIHPALYIDNEYDPLFRINSLVRLSNNGEIIATLRSVTLLKDISGEISVRDACALLDGSKQEIPGYPGGKTRLISELNSKSQSILEHFQQAKDLLISIQEKLQVEINEIALPDFSQLFKILNLIIAVNQSSLSLSNTEGVQLSPSLSETNEGSVNNITKISTIDAETKQSNWRQLDISNRDDAILMLDKVKSYFTLHEPSHPAPLMIDRVQRLISLDFMEIIQDLAPDGMTQLKTILGIKAGN